MKIGNIVLALLFALFAFFQWNDPDPLRWMLMYGLVAAIFAFAAAGRHNRYVVIGGLLISFIWMITLLPDFIDWIKMGMPTITGGMKAESPHVELTREFLGLLICVAALSWAYYQAKRTANGPRLTAHG